MKNVRFVGLDVHAETIAVAVAEPNGEVRSLGIIPNRAESIGRLMRKLGKPEQLRVCYEAGPTGYVLYWQLSELGVKCEVVAPTLVPVKAGDRVKTDRRDAEKLARLFRAGELTSIRVPTEVEEALRDLIRCREDGREDVLRQRHRLLKFLLRHGRVFRETKHWTLDHWRWLRGQRFEQPLAQTVFTEYLSALEKSLERVKTLDQDIASEATRAPYKELVGRLRCLRGIDTLSAMALIAEICDFDRFEHPRELMAYLGLVPSERSSGGKQRRGGITKTGNAHLRRVIVEAAWAYQFRAWLGGYLLRRQTGLSQEVRDIAWKAQNRLHLRYRKFLARGKNKPQIVTAVGRELLGFIWAIGVKVEAEQQRIAA